MTTDLEPYQWSQDETRLLLQTTARYKKEIQKLWVDASEEQIGEICVRFIASYPEEDLSGGFPSAGKACTVFTPTMIKAQLQNLKSEYEATSELKKGSSSVRDNVYYDDMQYLWSGYPTPMDVSVGATRHPHGRGSSWGCCDWSDCSSNDGGGCGDCFSFDGDCDCDCDGD